MVYVAAGAFTMGLDEQDIAEMPIALASDELTRRFHSNCIADNGPRREVHLDGYWIYKYPVTIGQYRIYCSETGAAMPRDAASIDDDLGERHPIDHITWHAAKAYCDWAGVRLCTEAEWEKALRGTDGRRYPWGDIWDPDLAARTDNWTNRTPVEAFDDLVSPYGAVDFYGDESQWCDDLYEEAWWAISPRHNPRGPASNRKGERVIRGGGCGDDPMAYVVSKRSFSDPLRAGQCGIRPVSDG
jgi:formylglycine-generating enzyme required for sulfatase activity